MMAKVVGIAKTGLQAVFAKTLAARNAARFQILDGFARRLGTRVYDVNMPWDSLEHFVQACDHQVFESPILGDRHFVLDSLASACAHLDGDTAECGVYKGAGSYLMCRHREPDIKWEHHIFDSFEGLSDPDDDDEILVDDAKPWSKHDLTVPLQTVQANLKEFSFVRYYQGWIPERFKDVEDRRFRLVHVDVDLYQPTLDSLKFFYPRLLPGGFLLCDDYGSTRCPGAKKACDEFVATTESRKVIHLTTGQGLIVRPSVETQP